jgi:hypothetical protein
LMRKPATEALRQLCPGVPFGDNFLQRVAHLGPRSALQSNCGIAAARVVATLSISCGTWTAVSSTRHVRR